MDTGLENRKISLSSNPNKKAKNLVLQLIEKASYPNGNHSLSTYKVRGPRKKNRSKVREQ